MSRKKIVWTLKIEIEFRDGEIQVIEKPCAEARDLFRYLVGCVLDFNMKCVKRVSLCDCRLKPLKEYIINY